MCHGLLPPQCHANTHIQPAGVLQLCTRSAHITCANSSAPWPQQLAAPERAQLQPLSAPSHHAATPHYTSPTTAPRAVQAFAYIDPEPLASASVAQVHSATLLGGGKPVVLKVLKPGVEDILTTDLNFLYLAVRFLQIVSPELERTSITGIIEDIRSSMLDEVRPPLALPCTVPPRVYQHEHMSSPCLALLPGGAADPSHTRVAMQMSHTCDAPARGCCRWTL